MSMTCPSQVRKLSCGPWRPVRSQDLHDRERHPAGAAPDAGAGAQQDAGRAALRRVQGVLPAELGGVLRLVLRLLPARGLRALERHLHREGRLDQRAHRADAPVGDQGAARAQRRDHRRDGVGDLRPRRSRGVPRDGPAPDPRRAAWISAGCCAGSRTCSTRATSSICRPGTYRVRGDVIDIFPAESEREAMRVELFDETIESLALFDPLTGEIQRKVPRYTVYPGSHYVTPRERLIGAIDQIRDELRERLKELREQNKLVEAQRLEQRTHVRHGDDEGGRLLRRHRELLALSVRPRAGRAAAVPVRLSAAATRCWSSTRVTRRFRSSAPCTRATARARRRWWNTASGCRRRSTTGRCKFEEWEQLAPQMIFVSATPGQYEARACGAGRRAAGAAHGPGGSGGRSAAGAHAGGRRAVGDQASARSRTSAC